MQEKLSISVDSGVVKRLRKLAADEDASLSAVIERLCVQGLGDAEAAVEARRDPVMQRVIAEMLRPENIERAARIVGETLEDPNLFRQRAAAAAAKRKR